MRTCRDCGETWTSTEHHCPACGVLHYSSSKAIYIPTPDELREAAAKIREGWNANEKKCNGDIRVRDVVHGSRYKDRDQVQGIFAEWQKRGYGAIHTGKKGNFVFRPGE